MPTSNFYARIGKLSSIILILPSSMIAGWLLGYFAIDYFLGSFPWGTLLFILAGAGAGFYQIIRLLTERGSDEKRPD